MTFGPTIKIHFVWFSLIFNISIQITPLFQLPSLNVLTGPVFSAPPFSSGSSKNVMGKISVVGIFDSNLEDMLLNSTSFIHLQQPFPFRPDQRHIYQPLVQDHSGQRLPLQTSLMGSLAKSAV